MVADPATTPQGKSLYPNLSQYAANRAQTVQREPNAVLSFQQFTSEPARNHPFAKPFWGLKPPTGVRIPPLRQISLLCVLRMVLPQSMKLARLLSLTRRRVPTGIGTKPSRLGIFGCGNSFSFSFAFSLTILFIYNEGGGGGLFVAGHEQRELKDHRTVA